MTAGLHATRWGSGERIVFVHGSFGWGEETFHAQHELADEYELLLPDRRGHGDGRRACRRPVQTHPSGPPDLRLSLGSLSVPKT